MAGVLVVCCPRVRIGSSPLHCPTLSCIAPSCVCCHSIVGLGLCLCGRVVSLWNSGDGLCWVEGRVVSIVDCLLSTHHRVVVCISVVCVVMACVMTVHVLSCRIVLWVVEWRCVRVFVVSLLVFLLFHYPLDSSFFSSLCWCSG